MDEAAVLGIDVGFSQKRASSCYCLLAWRAGRVRLSFQKVGIARQERADKLRGVLGNKKRLEAVAIDGPLTQSLRLVPHYRAAEALLSRGVFQKRGKPGQTSSPTGQQLHDHATQFARLILAAQDQGGLDLDRASHLEPIHELAVVEAFPNQFLAALIPERAIPQLHRDASDRFWELAAGATLGNLLGMLLPGHSFECSLEAIKDHDERAALVCALTALAIARGQAIGVGDPVDGDIFLPPSESWGASVSGGGSWMEAALRRSADRLRHERKSKVENPGRARVRRHREYWF